MPIHGAGNPMMQRMLRWHVDDNGNTRGTSRDAQARVDARTGLMNHGASAGANAKEAIWDAIGMIPVVGGIANIGRGIVKGITGLATGRGYMAKEGLRNIVKGALYSIPGWGSAIAGVNLAKNTFDTVAHGAFALHDKARYGGNAGKQQFVLQMMHGNMGYGAGLASPYPQMASPGYW